LFATFVLATASGTNTELLVQRLKATASQEIGITKEEQEVAKELQNVGAEAIPLLLPLLNDDNAAIRQLTAYTLRDIDGLTDEHLDALIAACRRGEGWIPPAIARIGTPRAVNFLIEELVRKRETQNQLTWAIEMLGSKAVPGLVRVYQNQTQWDEDLDQTMQSVMRRLGAKAASAVDPLFALATDNTQPAAKRRRAIIALGLIGEPAQAAVMRLQQQRDYFELSSDSDLKKAVDDAVVRLGASEAVPILTRALKESPESWRTVLVMRDIAALSERGVKAGPAVIKYLNVAEWELRVAAARTLGYIKYRAAGRDLAVVLKSKEDWRLALCAAESLGRLKDERAVASLEAISKNHWHPRVRQAAEHAISGMRGVDAKTENSTESPSPIETFFDYENLDDEIDSLQEADVPLLRFPVAVSPSERLVVENGHFIATDNGEWGGETKFIDSREHAHLVVSENTQALYRTTTGALAVAGLAHMDSNKGAVYKLSKRADDSWAGEKWRASLFTNAAGWKSIC
jgi:HEAT repeat protein